MSTDTQILVVRRLTPEAFAPFGHVAMPVPGDAPAGHHDVRPDLGAGTPRFYLMRLERRGLRFERIARHVRVTQCLGAMGGRPWLLAVAPPARLDDPTACPKPPEISAFRIPGDEFIMLHKGTWHAGPYFDTLPAIDFFNLELEDTNRVDFHECDLVATCGHDFAFAVSEATDPQG